MYNLLSFFIFPFSIQYLQYPDKVFKELYRVLKPGGVCIITFSNRMFFQKVSELNIFTHLNPSNLFCWVLNIIFNHIYRQFCLAVKIYLFYSGLIKPLIICRLIILYKHIAKAILQMYTLFLDYFKYGLSYRFKIRNYGKKIYHILFIPICYIISFILLLPHY